MKWILAIIAVVFSFSAEQAFADTFRCPNGNLVSTGDSISTVAATCDPPAGTFKREEPMEVEVSRADNTTTLIFRNGVLSEVRTGGFVQ